MQHNLEEMSAKAQKIRDDPRSVDEILSERQKASDARNAAQKGGQRHVTVSYDPNKHADTGHPYGDGKYRRF